jgi:hypothetical protein
MKILFTYFFIIAAYISSAQVKKNKPVKSVEPTPQVRPDYQKFPYWIAMMYDTTVKYNEAKFAFEEFWKNRELPEETEGEAAELYPAIETKSIEDTIVNESTSKGLHFKNAETYKYIYEYKRMKWWLKENEVWVNPYTGKVYSQQEKYNILTNKKK